MDNEKKPPVQENGDSVELMMVVSNGNDAAAGRLASVRLIHVIVGILLALLVASHVRLHLRVNYLEQSLRQQCLHGSELSAAAATADDDDDGDATSINNDKSFDSAQNGNDLNENSRHRVRRSLVDDDAAYGADDGEDYQDAGHRRHRRNRRRKNDVAITLAMNVPLYGNYRAQWLEGQTIILPHGEFSRYGYVPALIGSVGQQHYDFQVWRVEDWAQNSQLYNYNPNNGRVTVKKNGIYFIYAQLLYHNAAVRSSYAIMVNNGTHTHEAYELAKCWSSVDVVSSDNDSHPERFKSCYVGQATILHRHSHVWIRDLYGTHVSVNGGSNFFGIIKISDL
jgi:hypothetical protein